MGLTWPHEISTYQLSVVGTRRFPRSCREDFDCHLCIFWLNGKKLKITAWRHFWKEKCVNRTKILRDSHKTDFNQETKILWKQEKNSLSYFFFFTKLSHCIISYFSRLHKKVNILNPCPTLRNPDRTKQVVWFMWFAWQI